MATVRIQLRRGTSSQWDLANPTLAPGEIGIETDTNTFKFGDGITAWNDLSYALSDTVDDYIPLSLKGVANGVAELDGQGYVPAAQLPPLAKVTVNAVADQSARLALTVEPGDIAIQADNGTTYVLESSPASNNANWKEISATAAISAAVSAHEADTTNVHGIVDTSLLVTTTGTQTLTNKTLTSPVINTPTGIVKADVGLSNVDNTSDLNKPVSTAQAAADTAVADAAANALSSHESATTGIHGIEDTASLVTTTASQILLSKSLTSPTLTGTPTAPTAANGTDTTQIATTEFVQNAIEVVVGAAPAALNTLSEIATSLNNDADLAGTLTTSISTKVAKSGDTMTGALDMSTNKVVNLGTPVNNADAVTKLYVDNLYQSANTLHTEHTSATTFVHGITDTANLVYTADDRLSDARNPLDNSVSTIKIQNNSVTTEKIADNNITTDKVVDLSITTSKINDLAVETGKMANLSVTTEKIADLAVTTAKIASESVTTDKVEDLAITTAKIENNSIDSNKLANNSVNEVHIINSAVTTDKIADSSILTAKLADDAVTTVKILDDAITTDKVADANVTTAKLADNAITTAKILNDAVTTDKIEDLNITTAKLADSAITSAKISNDAVTADKISSDSVTTLKIADLNVTNAKLSADSVTTDKIADANVTTAKIQNNAVTTDKITDLNVTTGKIADDAITSEKLADGSVVTAALADDSVTSEKLADGSVVTAALADGSITSAKIENGTIVDADISASALIAQSKISGLTSDISAKAPIESPTFTGTVSGITKSMVGLANVDNTSDSDKPVSTATQTALDLKANKAQPTFTGTVTASDDLVVNGNLTVNGTTFNASSTSIVIEDNMLQLAHQNSANSVDLGIVVGYNENGIKHSGIVRDVSDNKWKLFKGVTTEPTSTVSFGEGSLDALAVGLIEATEATIGNVSNTEIQYLDGVTSAIQSQIDAKSPTSSPTFTGTVTVGESGIAFADKTQTKAGVPSLTPILSTVSANTTLDALGSDANVRDSLVPISGAFNISFESTGNAKYSIGSSITFYQSSGTGGNITGNGVTILSTPGSTLRTTYSSVTATKVAASTWLLAGDLKA